MGKYDDLIFTIPQEHHSWYGFVAPRGFFRGTTMMEKAHVYMDWTAVNKPLPMEVPHTHHCADEYLVFTNADMSNFFEFDAEIDVWLGDDAENMEMFTITQPTTLYIPQCGNARRGIDLVYVKRVPLLGDINRDGQVDIYDVTALIDIILEGDTTPPYEMTQYDHEAADMNNDNSIDVYDVTLLIDFILNKE